MDASLLDSMEEREEFDAFNDDTFGDSAATWDEEDHEQLAKLELDEHQESPSPLHPVPNKELKSEPSMRTLAELEAELMSERPSSSSSATSRAPAQPQAFLHPSALEASFALPPRLPPQLLLPPHLLPPPLPPLGPPPPVFAAHHRHALPPPVVLLQHQLAQQAAHQAVYRHAVHQQVLRHQAHQLQQLQQQAPRDRRRDVPHHGYAGPVDGLTNRKTRNPYDSRNRETFGDATVDDFEEEQERALQQQHRGLHQRAGHHERRGQLIMPGQVHVRRVLTGNPDRDRRLEESQQQSLFSHFNDDGQDDPFAGLMTARDRQWVINIQLQQLKCDNPFLDDYYYTVYTQKREEEQQQQRLKSMQQRSDEEGPQLLKSKETNGLQNNNEYRPVQFENSLGKLQAMSVKAPRKMIDVDVHQVNDGNETMSIGDAQRDARNYKSTLLELERMYSTLILVEDSEKKLSALPTNTPMRQEVLEEREQAMKCLRSHLCQEERLKRFWSVRKGKKLIQRSLRLLDHTSLSILWCSLFHSLAQAIKRDREESLLPDFIPHIRQFVLAINQEDEVLKCISSFNVGRRLKVVLASPFGVAIAQMLVVAAVQTFGLQQHSTMKELATALADVGAKVTQPLPWDTDMKKIDCDEFKALFQDY